MTDPVLMMCSGCGKGWNPGHTSHCPDCGPGLDAVVPDRVFTVSHIPDTNIYFGPAPSARFHLLNILDSIPGLRQIVDVSDDLAGRWTTQPPGRFLENSNIDREVVAGLIDHNDGALATQPLDFAVRTVLESEASDGDVYVHCVLGLRRAPTIVYAALRKKGWQPIDAWRAVTEARPFLEPVPLYLQGVEYWLLPNTSS